MLKRMLFLTLALTAAMTALPAAEAAKGGGGSGGSGIYSCPRCVTYADGSQCCVSCICENGIPLACTDHYCPPAGGGD